MVLSLLAFVLALTTLLRLKDPDRYEAATIHSVGAALATLVEEPAYWRRVYATLYLTAKGFGAGLIVAALGGIAIGLAPKVADRVVIALNGVRAVPLTLLIPFMGVMPVLFPFPPGVESHEPSKDPAYLIALGTALYILVGIAEGVDQRDRERERIARRVYGLSRLQYLYRIALPEALPNTLTACRLAALFALVLAIVLEQLLQYPGVGLLISEMLYEDTEFDDLEAQAIGLLLVVALIGIAIDGAYWVSREIVLRWQSGGQRDML